MWLKEFLKPKYGRIFWIHQRRCNPLAEVKIISCFGAASVSHSSNNWLVFSLQYMVLESDLEWTVVRCLPWAGTCTIRTALSVWNLKGLWEYPEAMCASGCLFEEKIHITCLLLFQQAQRPERPFTTELVFYWNTPRLSRTRAGHCLCRLNAAVSWETQSRCLALLTWTAWRNYGVDKWKGISEFLQCWGISVWGAQTCPQAPCPPYTVCFYSRSLKPVVLFSLCTCLHAGVVEETKTAVK